MRSRKSHCFCNTGKCSSKVFKGRRRFTEPTPPLKNPVGPSSLMPQSEVNPPAHLHEIKIKENLNYTVLIYTIIQRISETENSGKPEQQNVETLNC